MVVEPGLTAVATPCEPDALEMVAILVLLDDQVTLVVIFWVVLSV